ncbi:LysR family transcriptional regulator [Aquabacterium sp.]|uniref:LysR family transcriptional regulator n=1 Tax=Aquabacterium sp. TaxID=1872578 RepID=UPI0025BA4997|nr:LysR family transcriptional regulator [Aquabacterium sp.]
MDFLNDMALFVEVVKAKGFRGAAEATGVPNSTVSRRIALLEKAVGLRLLHRTTRRVELTEAGQLYYERCRRIVEEARLAHEQLGEMLAQPSGVLRASLPVDFATVYLAPLITAFGERHPGIRFEFDLTPRRVDLVTEPFDVAIRMGGLPDSGLIAQRLALLNARVYATPRYLARAGEPRTPQALSQHECLCFPKADTWTLERDGLVIEVPVTGRYTLNSVGMIRRLALLDQGLMLLPKAVVADDLASGQVVEVLPGWQGRPVPVYALTETRLLPAKTQRFIEFLKERLAAAD